MKPLRAGEAAWFWSEDDVLYVLSGVGGVTARIESCELTRLGVIYSVDTVLALPSTDSSATNQKREKVVESAATLGSGGGSTSAYLVMFVILALYGLKTIPLIKYII